jgi:DNA-binding NarL/FixJ family response regulator
MTYRILLADDHGLFRQALRIALEQTPGMSIVAEAGNGEEVITAARDARPDVICLDTTMPGPSCPETIRQLLEIDPAMKIIAISAHPDLFRVARMIKAGALGYVTKMDIAKQLPPAIVRASQNQRYFSSDLYIRDVADLAPYETAD